MPLLRGNLHAHTTFSDGVRSPAALVAEYEALGYDFLAITDHEDHDNWVEPGYQRALERLRPELLLFRGVELNFDPLSQHVGKVIGDRETLYVLNHPARYRLSVEQVVGRIRKIRRAGLPTAMPDDVTPPALALAMHTDKKTAAGRIRFVCVEAIGRTRLVELSAEQVADQL